MSFFKKITTIVLCVFGIGHCNISLATHINNNYCNYNSIKHNKLYYKSIKYNQNKK